MGTLTYYFNDSIEFLETAEFSLNRQKLNISAFLLHQAVERTYNTLILVFTGYKSKTHNLGKLIRMSRDFSTDLQAIFPNNSPEETHLFTLLKKAYIDARYNENYRITQNEVKELIDRVRNLQKIATRICLAKINSF